jgi:hypothetical protein
MDEYTVPPVNVVIDFVKQYDRRVGLRMLYGRYNIPKNERDKYRELWSKFYDLLPDAFEKELEDGSDMHSESGRVDTGTGERDRQEGAVRNDEHD